MRGLLM
jgi:hypothetical protein